MSVEENKALVLGFWEATNAPDWEARLLPHFPDREQWAAYCDMHRPFRASFPDFHVEIDGIMGEGERVSVWLTASGTFTKPFEDGGLRGVRPSGQKLEWHEGYVYDFSGPEVEVLYWGVDELGRMRQVGAAS